MAGCLYLAGCIAGNGKYGYMTVQELIDRLKEFPNTARVYCPGRPVLVGGKLGFGFALPGLHRSLTELVKLNLKR